MIDGACTSSDGDFASIEELIPELNAIRRDLIDLERCESTRVNGISEFYRAMPGISSITLRCDVTTSARCRRSSPVWAFPRSAGRKVTFWRPLMRFCESSINSLDDHGKGRRIRFMRSNSTRGSTGSTTTRWPSSEQSPPNGPSGSW